MKVPCPKCKTFALPGTNCDKCGTQIPGIKKRLPPTEQTPLPPKQSNKKLFSCPDCGSIISRSAPVCPVCGTKIQNIATKAAHSVLQVGCGLIVLAIFIPIIFGMFSSFFGGKQQKPKETPVQRIEQDKTQKRPSLTEAEKEQQKIEREKKRAEEYELCKTSLQCWGDKHSLSATFASQKIIERHAKFQFKWTDGWLGSKMTHFRWENIEQSTITYFGDQIQFQNTFGAWQYMTYQCDYDPINEKVLDVRVHAGRLPISE